MPALNAERPRISGHKHGTDRNDLRASIGYYLKDLSPYQHAILILCYGHNESAHAIAREIKSLFPSMFVNNHIITNDLRTTERKLTSALTEAGIIEQYGF